MGGGARAGSSLNTKLDTLQNSITNIKNAIKNKGGKITDSTTLKEYASIINSIPTGTEMKIYHALADNNTNSEKLQIEESNADLTKFSNIIFLKNADGGTCQYSNIKGYYLFIGIYDKKNNSFILGGNLDNDYCQKIRNIIEYGHRPVIRAKEIDFTGINVHVGFFQFDEIVMSLGNYLIICWN